MGSVGPAGHPERKSGKRGRHGGDNGVGAKWRAAMDVRRCICSRLRSLKLPLISSVLATVSSTYRHVARSRRMTGLGTSFAPERLAVKITVAAFRAGTVSISAAVI